MTTDENGNSKLVKAEDAKTPLANIDLGDEHDHLCNILYFLLLLLSFAVAMLHANRMKKHQKRIFELKDELDELR